MKSNKEQVSLKLNPLYIGLPPVNQTEQINTPNLNR